MYIRMYICNSNSIGTGKSTVGAHLAYAFAKLNQINKRIPSEKNRCVVYCGASNVSVDVVASMFMSMLRKIAHIAMYFVCTLAYLHVYGYSYIAIYSHQIILC